MKNVRFCFFFQAKDGIRDSSVTGVQTCALPIWNRKSGPQKKLPKLRGLPPKLAHRRIPAGLIEAGHEIVIKIVELGIRISAWRCFMLPQKNGCGEIHPLLDEVRKNLWASRDAPVVISNESDYANQNCSDR